MRLKGKKHRRLRDKVFKRDNGVCYKCEQDCKILDAEIKRAYRLGPNFYFDFRIRTGIYNWSSWHADHIVRVADNGTNDLQNIRTLCQFCHTERHSHE